METVVLQKLVVLLRIGQVKDIAGVRLSPLRGKGERIKRVKEDNKNSEH